jgi:N-acetylglucosamine kinase-like BadF-type ATPase
MGYVLGVDGGNSKTLAAVGDDTGTILGVARAGGSNHQGLGLAEAMEHIRAAADGAVARAGLAPYELDVAYYALAGADLPEDFALLRPALEDLRFGNAVGLNNDSAASLRSGTDNPNAVVVGWGSGANAMGRNAAGQEIRLPALGEISGDWGGGDDLAREAIRLVARAHDGRGMPTALTEIVLGLLQVPDVDEMIRTLYFRRVSPDFLRRLTPLIFRAADQGDAVARALVERAAEEVAVTALALLRRLGLTGVQADVVLGGSVFRTESPLLLHGVTDRVQEAAPLARVVVPEIEPVVGSYFWGLDMAGIAVHGDVRARARRSYEAAAGRTATEARAR